MSLRTGAWQVAIEDKQGGKTGNHDNRTIGNTPANGTTRHCHTDESVEKNPYLS